MADYDHNGELIAAGRDLGGAKAWCHVMYALHAFSAFGGLLGSTTIIGGFLFGWPSIIAVIINYVTRGNVNGTWLDSHWRWQLRTFWYAAAWAAGGMVLFFTLIGIPAALVIWGVLSLWLLYRVARGWVALSGDRPMPVPAA
jgi:uncharacterized membrane protein